MKNTKRKKLICKRWRDIVLMTILATLCIVYLEPIIKKLAILLQEIGSNWNVWFILFVYLFIPLAVGAFLKAIGGFRFKDFDVIYSCTNPPAWYASLFGICLYPVLSFHLNESPYLDKPLIYWSIIFFAALLVIGTAIGKVWRSCLRRSKQNESTEPNSQITLQDELLKDTAKSIEWLQKEKPIDGTDDDLFDSIVVARRIAMTLTEKPFKTISLIGPYGSGKTSILNLAQKELKKQEDKLIIPISAWGYEDKNLTGYILRNIVRQISKYTDCLNTYLVPIKFQSIFFDNSWGLFNFLKFLFALESPDSLIRKINDVLKRSGKELIIFLEDIDRNQNKNIHHQLYSLFNYFVDMDSISFVVTYGADNVVAEPLTKITDKTEIVPKLSRFTIRKWLVKFREHCLDKHNDIYVPGFDRQKINERIGLLHDHSDQYHVFRQRLFAEMGLNPESYKAIDCIIELLRYPRRLKRALTHTCAAWDKLHGEIYFDDLLVIQIIKATACELFHLIVNNINQFKMFADSKTKADNKELCQRVETALDVENVPDKMLYHKLIQFLFPGWHSPDQSHESKITDYVFATLNPQGIASDSNVDYFARAFAEELPENELSDQYVMRLLLDYNSDKYSETEVIVKIMDSEQFAERIEYFGKLLAPAKVLALTSEYFKAISNKKLYVEFHNHQLTGRLWRMSLDNYETEENHKYWLENQIDKYLLKSLKLANDIFYFWSYRTRSESESKQYPPELHKMYIEKIKQLTKKPEQLVEVLTHDMPFIWILGHRLFGNYTKEEIKKAAGSDFFSNWQPWLANSLIKASQKAPAIIAMYTAPLVYDLNNITFKDEDDKMRQGWKASFDKEIGKMLFGDNLQKFMKIISILKEDDYKNYSDLDEQAKTLLDYAVTHSKQWLLDNPIKQ